MISFFIYGTRHLLNDEVERDSREKIEEEGEEVETEQTKITWKAAHAEIASIFPLLIIIRYNQSCQWYLYGALLGWNNQVNFSYIDLWTGFKTNSTETVAQATASFLVFAFSAFAVCVWLRLRLVSFLFPFLSAIFLLRFSLFHLEMFSSAKRIQSFSWS